MKNSSTLAVIVSLCVVSLGGCLTPPDDELAPELGQVESELEWTLACQDQNNFLFQAPQSCTKNGQLGLKDCQRTCDIDRAIVPNAGGGLTCRIVSATCTPWVCGPCQVVEFEGPLP